MLRELLMDELSHVAGGEDTRGVNETFVDSPYTTTVLVSNSNGTVVQNVNEGIIAVDYNNDGVFDEAWTQQGDGTWMRTTDGEVWWRDDNLFPDGNDPGPWDEIDRIRDIGSLGGHFPSPLELGQW